MATNKVTLSSVMKDITVDIRVTGQEIFRIRTRISVWIIRLAIFILGAKSHVTTAAKFDEPGNRKP